jgi:phospholipase C
MPVTHESILKLISYRFRLGHLTKRHQYASNIGRSFNFRNPDFEPPELPDPVAVCQGTCSTTGGAQGPERPKPHDMLELETSGYLERLGYEYKPPTYSDLFREPEKVRAAMEAAPQP